MNVLVTGGAGYIGSHTCVELLREGCGVVILDNLCNSSAGCLDRIRVITGREPRFYQGDVRDEALLRRIFTENDIGCVIHFAGLKAVGESVAQPWRYYDHNLNATLSLTRVMGEFGVKKLIFSSSATVYSADNDMPLKESSRTGSCTSPYGWSKFMSEQILSDMARADGEWSICLLRYFNPIGAHESGLLGEDPRGVPTNLMPYITQVAIGRRAHLSVYGGDYDTPDGTGIRDYIHVVDLARGHVAAMGYVDSNSGCEVFNLGTGVGCSVLEMVHTFIQTNGVAVPYRITARRPGDVPRCCADPTRSARLLGWKASRNLQDMCRDAWNWQRKNPNGYEG